MSTTEHAHRLSILNALLFVALVGLASGCGSSSTHIASVAQHHPSPTQRPEVSTTTVAAPSTSQAPSTVATTTTVVPTTTSTAAAAVIGGTLPCTMAAFAEVFSTTGLPGPGHLVGNPTCITVRTTRNPSSSQLFDVRYAAQGFAVDDQGSGQDQPAIAVYEPNAHGGVVWAYDRIFIENPTSAQAGCSTTGEPHAVVQGFAAAGITLCP